MPTSSGMRKFFATSPGSMQHPEVAMFTKDRQFAYATLGVYLTTKYALCFDVIVTSSMAVAGV